MRSTREATAVHFKAAALFIGQQLVGWSGVAAALALLGLSLAVRVALHPWLGDDLAYPAVIFAVLLASWYCGTGPAVLIAVLGYPAVELLIRDVPFSGGELEHRLINEALYGCIVAITIYFVTRIRRGYEELIAAQQELRRGQEQLTAAQQELLRSEQHNRAFFQHAALGMVEIDKDDRLTAVNDNLCRILGYTADELVGRSVYDISAPEDQVTISEFIYKVRHGELNRLDCENRCVRRDGSVVWVHATLSAIRSASRDHSHCCIGTFEDITERKNAEQALQESKEQFEQLANHIPEAFWITDLERRTVIYISPAFERIHGASFGPRPRARAWKKLLHPEDRDRVLDAHRNLTAGAADLKYRIVRPDGAIRWVHARGYPIKNAHGVVYRVAGTIEDITQRRELEQKLQYQAHFDSLTALPNRVVFFDRLGQALNHARRVGHSVGLLFVDLDKFKFVNNTFGHNVGDDVLKHIAGCLKRSVRAEDTVARLSGDDFAIILPRVDKPEHASMIAQKVLRIFVEPFRLDSHEVAIDVSIGVAISGADGSDPETLVNHADRAMLRAKQLGRNQYAFYTAAMSEEVAEQRRLEGLLRRALDHKKFSLHYQPKANIRSGELTGCEALLRWTDPDANALGPAQFVPILEESGLIVPVGEWVVRAACKQLSEWKQAGIAPVPIAINVSTKQFNQTDLAALIEAALDQNGIDSNLLQVELTESVAMQNAEETIKSLHALKVLGIAIAIDDFGTGHSSLSYLTRLPIDVLKIDRSFVTGLPDNQHAACITKAIITMAQSLFLKVVAEGVEDRRQFEFLARNECDEVQGYLLSRPVSAPEMTRLMRTQPVLLH